MGTEFNAYEPVIGMELNSIHIMRATVGLQFCDPKNAHVQYDINLSTMADLCIREEEIFKPASDYDAFRPADLPILYSGLGKTVLDFKPLGKKRVCKMDFENFSLFTWADEYKLPDCLFTAEQGRNYENFKWWLIDDQ